MRQIILLLLCLISVSVEEVNAQNTADTIVVKNLLSEAFVYDNSLDSYIPLIDRKSITQKSFHINLNDERHAKYILEVKASLPISLYIDNKLVMSLKPNQSRLYSTDSLFERYGAEFKMTLYGSDLSQGEISLNLLSLSSSGNEFLEEEDIILVSQRKDTTAFNNFLLISLLLISGLLAVLNNYYPKITRDFFRIGRAFSMREIDENLLKSRPFTLVNIFFYVFFSLLVGFGLIVTFQLGSLGFTDNLRSTGSFLWFWLEVSGIILFWIFIKYMIISYFTSLFNIKSFLASHFFNYVRIGFIFFVTLAILLTVSYLGVDFQANSYYKVVFNIVLISVVIRSIVLTLKLMNTGSYKFLHLFSYLCGTEYIPLGVIFFLGLNQHF